MVYLSRDPIKAQERYREYLIRLDLQTIDIPYPMRVRLIERLERATADGRLQIDGESYAKLLTLLFSEDFTEPEAPPTPATTAPGSQRAATYAARVAAGQQVFHPDDADPVINDRLALLVRKLSNGNGVKIEGWSEGALAESD